MRLKIAGGTMIELEAEQPFQTEVEQLMGLGLSLVSLVGRPMQILISASLPELQVRATAVPTLSSMALTILEAGYLVLLLGLMPASRMML